MSFQKYCSPTLEDSFVLSYLLLESKWSIYEDGQEVVSPSQLYNLMINTDMSLPYGTGEYCTSSDSYMMPNKAVLITKG